MLNKKAILVFIAFVITTVLFSNCSRPPSQLETIVQINKPAPKFKLPDLNGQEVSLDQFKGKIVMLDFWATWCGPCRMTMPVLESLEKEYKHSLVLLAINLQDSKDVVSDYVREQALNSRILLDEDGSVGSLYGTDSIPMQFLLDKNGIVRHVQMGFNPRMASQLRAEIEKLR